MNPRSFLLALILAMLWPAKALQSFYSPWAPIGRGIDYQEFTLSGPVKVFVTRMDRHNPTVTLETSLAGGAFGRGFETVRKQSARYEDTINYWHNLDRPTGPGQWGKRSDVVVAINGSYIDQNNRALPENGIVQSGWYAKRYEDHFGWSGFVLKQNGEAFVGDCVFHDPQRQILQLADGSRFEIGGLNRLRGEESNELILYTSQFGDRSAEMGGGIEVVVNLTRPLMIAPESEPVVGQVASVSPSQGRTPIQFDQVIISAVGKDGDRILQSVQAGQEIRIFQEIAHFDDCQDEGGTQLADFSGAYTSIGGAHTFLRNGEVFPHAEDVVRHPRTAIAYNADYIFFIVVDGRDPYWSIGMTIEELGYFTRDQLGAAWGIAQDGGGSSTMVINGMVVNNPSDVCKEGEPHTVYMPQVSNGAKASQLPPRIPIVQKVYPSYHMKWNRCERAVPNGMMMVEVEPMAQSVTYQPGVAVTTLEEVNLRLGPGTNYAVLARLQPGKQGVILEQIHGLNGVFATGYHWWKVEFDGMQGWIAESYIR